MTGLWHGTQLELLGGMLIRRELPSVLSMRLHEKQHCTHPATHTPPPTLPLPPRSLEHCIANLFFVPLGIFVGECLCNANALHGGFVHWHGWAWGKQRLAQSSVTQSSALPPSRTPPPAPRRRQRDLQAVPGVQPHPRHPGQHRGGHGEPLWVIFPHVSPH